MQNGYKSPQGPPRDQAVPKAALSTDRSARRLTTLLSRKKKSLTASESCSEDRNFVPGSLVLAQCGSIGKAFLLRKEGGSHLIAEAIDSGQVPAENFSGIT